MNRYYPGGQAEFPSLIDCAARALSAGHGCRKNLLQWPARRFHAEAARKKDYRYSVFPAADSPLTPPVLP
jgi:hypothetical protein